LHVRNHRLPAVLVAVVIASVAASEGRSSSEVTTRLTVTGGEYYFKASKSRVPRGTVYVTFVNAGSEPHDLKFTGKTPATRVLLPGTKQTIKLVFKKRGRYMFQCTIGEHALNGMTGTLVVR
jgi:plastocyanin